MLRTMLCLFGLCLGTMGAWLNDYDKPFNFQCPSGQFLSHIQSQHDNGPEDRVWDLSCYPVPVQGTLGNCQLSNWVNEFNLFFTYQCPRDGFITGMYSEHSNQAEDRRFKIRCCEIPDVVAHACSSTHWQNVIDGLLNYRVPANKVLRGVTSQVNNGAADRQFAFEICDLTPLPTCD